MIIQLEEQLSESSWYRGLDQHSKKALSVDDQLHVRCGAFLLAELRSQLCVC